MIFGMQDIKISIFLNLDSQLIYFCLGEEKEYRYSVIAIRYSGGSDFGPFHFLMYNPESGNVNGNGGAQLRRRQKVSTA
jgi:hypothetical protein